MPSKVDWTEKSKKETDQYFKHVADHDYQNISGIHDWVIS